MDYIDKARSWLDARLPVSEAREFAAKKTVPVHRYTVLYYLGGMTLFFFIVQVITGILLRLADPLGPLLVGQFDGLLCLCPPGHRLFHQGLPQAA
jgi:hypothetical protein